MPNRIFREGFVDSDSICALSDWAHRVYSNLLVKVDDAGRIDGRLEPLRAILFPLGLDRPSEDLHSALADLELRKLAILYGYAGKPYLQITKWQRCGSAINSRCPWSDGSFDIEYVQRPTRDGVKDFVRTSVSLSATPCGRGGNGVSDNSLISQQTTPSAPPAHGVASVSNTKTNDEDELRIRITKTNRSFALKAESLSVRCLEVLGNREMTRYGSRWRKRCKEEPEKIDRVLNEIVSNQKEGTEIKNAGAYAEDLWKQFK